MSGFIFGKATSFLASSAAPWLVAGAVALAGTGGTVWYRMQYLDCKAAGAAAYEEQRKIDREDNAAAIAQLNESLNKTNEQYLSSMERLKNVPKDDSCNPTEYQRAVTDELCKLYPTSGACGGSVTPR